jgi:hypothetical protein
VAKVKPKMIYASSKEELKKRLVGLACEIQGSDQGDVEFDEVFSSSMFAILFIVMKYPRPSHVQPNTVVLCIQYSRAHAGICTKFTC